VALAGQDENDVAVTGQLAGAGGHFPAHAPDDFSFGLAGGPGEFFPFAHGGDIDDRKCHGASVAELSQAKKRNVNLFITRPFHAFRKFVAQTSLFNEPRSTKISGQGWLERKN
jgi:hypothetical protein